MEKLRKENSLYQIIKKNVSGSERIAMQEFFAEKYVYEYQATEKKFFFFAPNHADGIDAWIVRKTKTLQKGSRQNYESNL